MLNATDATILDLTARLRAAVPVKLTRGDAVVVGQRTYEDRQGRSGVVVEISGYYCTVVMQDGATTSLPLDMLTGGPGVWSGRAEVAHADEVALAVAMAAARKSSEKRALEAAAVALAAEVAALKATHPELEIGSTREVAAKNMRKVLKAAFPGVAFSVRQPRGSMVYSIDVTWTGGPAREDVAALAGLFVSSRFDGMTDGYDSCRTAWTDTFGGCNGVFCRRE